jgi:hypothetical protein
MARDFCLGTNPVDYLEEHGVFCLDDVRIHLGRLGETEVKLGFVRPTKRFQSSTTTFLQFPLLFYRDDE